MRGGVRLERGEPLRRTHMTLLAGLQAVVRMHLRLRIVYALDAMAAVAVEALGRIGVTQFVDLAVVGLGIGFQALMMTVAAVLGDGEPGRILCRIFDVVGGMAIRADRRDRVTVVQHCFALRTEVAYCSRSLA